MRRSIFLLALVLVSISPAAVWAHGFAGKRFFPTTFQVDDPFISDEFSVLVNNMKSGDPSSNSTEINIDYSKRIAPDFGLEFHDAYQHSTSAGGDANGWENFDVGAKWQFLTNEEHEAIASFGTDVEIGGTGARQVSDSFSTISPALFFGKGLPELPEALKYLRPLALTGIIGPNFPTRSTNLTDTGIERNPVLATPYGLTVAAKIVLFFIILALGAFNSYVSVPALEQWAGCPCRKPWIDGKVATRFFSRFAKGLTGHRLALRFKRLVRVEMFLVAALLFCADLLTHELPARHYMHMKQMGQGHTMQMDPAGNQSKKAGGK